MLNLEALYLKSVIKIGENIFPAFSRRTNKQTNYNFAKTPYNYAVSRQMSLTTVTTRWTFLLYKIPEVDENLPLKKSISSIEIF